MTLNVVDSLAWVKRNGLLFFPGGEIDVIRLIAYVMGDVIELGGGECRIVQRDGWSFVSSDVDWLAHELSVKELFERVVPAPQHGEHSMRAEVLLNAYADDVIAAANGTVTLIKGQAPDSPLLESMLQANDARRLIAFRRTVATDVDPDRG